MAMAGKGSATEPLWKKAIVRQEKWDSKEDFLDIIYWMRQLLSVVTGVLWGIFPMQGFIGMGLFLLLNAGSVYLYSVAYQKVDEEEFGGTWEILKEGFMTSYTLFLVNWIMSYTTFHFG